MKTAILLVLAVFALPVRAATPLEEILSAKILPAENRIVYDFLFKAVHEADLKADVDWSACTTPAALRTRQAEVRARLVAALGGFPEHCPFETLRKGGFTLNGANECLA